MSSRSVQSFQVQGESGAADMSGKELTVNWGVQVLARTITMQFEGNWTPVTDIVVDKVGKYAYVIGSIHDTAATPVVMDVILDVRTKVSFLLSWHLITLLIAMYLCSACHRNLL